MDLGHFSLSLAVANIDASFSFYRDLGFELYDDHMAEKWVILRNGDMLLGLFEGMFDENIMTFHPTSIAGIRERLAAKGMVSADVVGDGGEAPTFLMLNDPDGNVIMIDEIDPNYKPVT